MQSGVLRDFASPAGPARRWKSQTRRSRHQFFTWQLKNQPATRYRSMPGCRSTVFEWCVGLDTFPAWLSSLFASPWQRGLVGPRCAAVWDVGWQESLWYSGCLRQPRLQHWRLPLPRWVERYSCVVSFQSSLAMCACVHVSVASSHPWEANSHPSVAVRQGCLHPEGLPQQEPRGPPWLPPRDRLHRHHLSPVLQDNNLGNGE